MPSNGSRNSVVREPSRDLPFAADADVVVVGGGPSGVAAAVTAARQGLKTLIIERYGFFGGMTVAGLSGTICGLYSSSSRNKLQQIVHGFAGDFVRLLKEKGGICEPYPFGRTALCVHDPLSWKETADALIQDAKVRVMFHTLFVDTLMEDRDVTGVIVENKEGRRAIKGKIVIDASGDGDVAARAGAPYVFGKDGFIQFPTMIFRMGNVDWEQAKKIDLHELEETISMLVQRGDYCLPRKHIYLLPTPHQGEALINATRIARPNHGVVNGTVAEDLTWSELEGRRQIREYERFLKAHVRGFAHAYIIDSATQIGIRQTRTILGKYTLTNEDIQSGRKFHSAIARSAWPIEAHGQELRIVYLEDDYYEIPFEVMLPQQVGWLLTVGRCISAEHEALASARVTAQCFEEGMAAGFAASLAVKEQCSLDQVDVQQIRRLMIKQGAEL